MEVEEGVVGGLPSIEMNEGIVSTFAEQDFVDHRQVYVGLHHRPAEKPTRRGAKLPKFILKKPPKIFRWENGKRVERHSDDSGSDIEKEVHSLPPPAAERVKFILGGDHEEEKVVHENPHLFTELEELFVCVDGNIEWKETARWYKYEEDVEEGGDRWSKPHVATLSLYSLLELRSSLMAGTVILDLDATTLSDIADLVLDNLVSCNKLEEIFRVKVRETLLRKHHHQRNTGFRRNLSNILSSRKSLNMLHQSASYKLNNRHSSNGTASVTSSNGHAKDESTLKIDSPSVAPSETKAKLLRNFSQPTFSSTKPVSFQKLNTGQGHLVYPSPSNLLEDDTNEKMPGFMKKLPPNSEASNILVGEVDFLEKPITAFVRLATSSVIGDLTEVPIPTRFLFVMLGPGISPGRYHEIGRAISTLMADEVFHEVAYRAKSREDLIAGIDEFLEQVTVLPPGEWDPSIRIDPPANGCAKISRRVMTEIKHVESAVEQQASRASENGELTEGEASNLFYSNKVFGGLLTDFRTWRLKKRDILDGLSLKCLGAVFLIYFSLLGFVMTVGKHQENSSGGYLGEREHLLSLAIIGLPFSLFSGQPLLVMSFTLPLSLFDSLLYKLCTAHYIDYLPLRLWVGIWTMLLLFLYVTFNVSKYVYYLTRFTLEIFIVLSPLVLLGYGFFYLCKMLHKFTGTSGLFTNQSCSCVEYIATNVTNGSIAFKQIIQHSNLRECNLNGWSLVGEGCGHDVVPYTIVLTVSTVLLVMFFSSIQHFGYLPSKLHQLFHDMAVLITILIISAIAYQFDVNISYVMVPKGFEPTVRDTWFVSPLGGNQLWIILLAFIPAVFLSLLIFVEQQVTACCINHKNKFLKKGFGYHLDLLVVLFGVGVSSIFGLPFSVASVVLSVNHVRALKDKHLDEDLAGFSTTIKEQRLTSLLVYILIALTPIMRPLLSYVPVSALYGILILVLCRTFLGVQFAKRVTLLFIREEQQPDLVYLRQVPLISVNIMTIVQVIGLLCCVALRATLGAVVFPFMVFLLAVARSLLELLLPLRDILALDEPMFKFPPRSRKSESNSNLITQVETGDLLDGEEKQEEVLLGRNRGLERVNISEELTKTAAWKQLTYENSYSPFGTSPQDDSMDGKKRRRKRSRDHSKQKDISPKLDGKQIYVGQSEDCITLTLPSDEDKNVRDSNDRFSSQRQSHDRNSSKRHDPLKRQSSHDRKRKTMKEKPQTFEAAPLPPWEQPYHSPPTKDFGRLKIPEDDLSIDPACSRSDSAKSYSNNGSNAPSVTNSIEHSRTNSLDELSYTKPFYTDYSRDASSEDDA